MGIKAGKSGTTSGIKEGRNVPSDKLHFSFQFFNQIEYFGLDQCDAKWFVSLLERLKDLSAKNTDELFTEKNKRGGYRYHEIDWNAKNTPIRKTDLNWIAKDILDNEEISFFQFAISTGKGRVIGYWQLNVFYIVLLDPLHNLQPAKDYSYKVDNCSPLGSQYESLLYDLKLLKERFKDHAELSVALREIPQKHFQASNVIYAFISDELQDQIAQLGEVDNISTLIEWGMEYYNRSKGDV